MPRVAVVVVTWNSEREIGPCLEAVADLDDVETVVVDNASSDATRREVASRGVRLIANFRNEGFAAAVNRGVRATTAPLLLLLNPDTHFERGLDALKAEFDNPKTGAAGGLLTGLNGLPQRGFMSRSLPSPAALILEVMGINRLWPGNPVNWRYRCLGRESGMRAIVEQPPGAFLMFSRTAWENVGGFDERFWPVWFEDVDFCAALKDAGYLVYFNPLAAAKHAGGRSIRGLSLEKRERYWYGSLLKYAAKRYSSPGYRSVCMAVAIGAGLRAVFALPRRGSKVSVVYGAVCRSAVSRLLRPGRGCESSVVRWRENS